MLGKGSSGKGVMLWGGEWFSLRKKVSTEPLQTLSSLPEEQQMDENVEALAHSPIEIIQIGEGKMEKETQEEDEKNEKVRGERKRP